MKTTTMWGCELTSLENMFFSKYLENNPQIPRPNTISAEERTELLSNWLKEYRECNEKT